MNSKIYLTLKRVGYKPEQFRQLYAEAENSHNNLLETIKAYQLKAPETLEKYCITAFNQITAEETRIIEILEHFDKTQTLESKYYSTDRFYLTEILNYAGSAKAEIVEYLAVYKPDIFKGSKRELIKEYLRPFNLIRKQFEANNSAQQPKSAKPNPKTKTREQIKIQFKTIPARKNVFEILMPYFEKQQEQLLKVLKGEKTEKLFFPHDSKRLTEFFRRLLYNNVIDNTDTQIMDFLCNNFEFFNDGKITPFSKETTYGNLTKERGNLAKQKRIGDVDWLPYLSHEQQMRRKQENKIKDEQN